ncbi:MAG: hypothetical protein KDB61_11320 [Planctomycetes bacterium]|nr:hypothetical protein [Planctomycetota bacterium]
MIDNSSQMEPVLPDRACLPPQLGYTVGTEGPKIHAIPPAQAMSLVPGGGLPSLVAFLDFAPRHRELALALARRFMRTLDAKTAGSLPQGALQDRFFLWLVAKTRCDDSRPRSSRRFHRHTNGELRLIGMLDQYRAGGHLADDSCPLFRAAYSEQV